MIFIRCWPGKLGFGATYILRVVLAAQLLVLHRIRRVRSSRMHMNRSTEAGEAGSMVARSLSRL